MSIITELDNNQLRSLMSECTKLQNSIAPATLEHSPTLKKLLEQQHGYLWGSKFSEICLMLTYEAAKRFQNETN